MHYDMLKIQNNVTIVEKLIFQLFFCKIYFKFIF